MWKARNFARHGMINPSEIWEHRVFEAAIRSWKNEVHRKGRELMEGAEERIRALPRKQKLTWVHNRLRDQKGIKEFWSTVPARSYMDAAAGRDPMLADALALGNVGQIPPDLPNKVQIRRDKENERKQRYITQFFSGGKSSEVTKKALEVTTVPATGLGPGRLHSKKRRALGDERKKASKTSRTPSKDLHEDANRSNQLEGTGVDRRILEDQVQIEEENQGDDRPRADAAPSQLTLTSGISEETRALIARNKEEGTKKKKDRDTGRKRDS